MMTAMMLIVPSAVARAQYAEPEAERSDSSQTTVLTLEDALRIALSENIAVKVADKEILRTEYARKGTYAALFPQVDASGSFQLSLIHI